MIGVCAGVGFVRAELRRRDPLFDVRALARPVVAAGAGAILSVYIAFLGSMFLLPQYLQYVQDRSVLEAGLLLTPLGLGAAVGARYNARVFAALGRAWSCRSASCCWPRRRRCSCSSARTPGWPSC